MPPDPNSLPSSRSPSSTGSPILEQLRRPSTSNMNTGLSEPSHGVSASTNTNQSAGNMAASPRSSSNTRPHMGQPRRSSNLVANTNSGDPTQSSMNQPFGSPQSRSSFSTADPHHQRAPSLGQIHQQLENEQEAQVNRLLHMIRVQQDQLSALQTPGESSEIAVAGAESQSAVSDTMSPQSQTTSSRPASTSMSSTADPYPTPRSPLQRPTSLSRQSSRGITGLNSHTSSPSLRPMSSSLTHDEWSMGGTRDDSAFYQAETQTLQRENQMLKLRIRELERQVLQMNVQTTNTNVPSDVTSA